MISLIRPKKPTLPSHKAAPKAEGNKIMRLINESLAGAKDDAGSESVYEALNLDTPFEMNSFQITEAARNAARAAIDGSGQSKSV